MISARLIGRLGNQMFQIAAALGLAFENNDIAVFDDIPQLYNNNIYYKLMSGSTETFKIYSEGTFNYKKIKYQNNLILYGYFQSEKYFKNYKNEIIDIFSNYTIINNLKNKFEKILKNSVSLHIRRGDYLAYPNIHPCPNIGYYIESIKYIENIKTIENILIFSDDIKYCKENFNDKRISFIENLNDYEDLYLMSLCENNIIANSTFSWWGSYLNKNKDKIVICPKIWFGIENKNDWSDIYYEGNIIKSNSINMITSLSDTDNYRNIIKSALKDDNVFNTFKQQSGYIEILEHVSKELGEKYLISIKKNNPQLLNSIEDFKLNDKYGGSNKINYDSIGEISPTTLRYINVLSNLISLGIDLNNKNIIEIGVGYGGQCLILSKYFKFKSYTLVDLIEPLLLSKKYLELNNVCNVKYNEMSDLKDNTQYDFVISNYAFSECCKEIQDIYIDKIIKNSKKGYMTLNFISDVYKIESYNKNDILKIINNSYYIEEEPNSFGNNMVLLWNKTYSQAGQDLFVSSLLDNGFFIDIGCGLPDNINNTLLLEENGWNGISIDNNEYHEKMWNRNTPFILDDANICNFNDILKKYNAPEIIDYLSLDINGYDGLRFSVLEKFFETNKEVKVITIAHDSYVGYKEKENQRKFLTNLGYYLLCTDVLLNNYAFEDWWINPKYFNENEYIFYKSNNIEYSNILGQKKLKEKIKISVLTLTYQRYEFLEEAIQSYLCQDFEGESEMVVINDSPDVEYVYDHPNIRIINCKERFKLISEKLEFGYKQCKYDYVYRLDDDDLLTPWALSVAYKHISKNIGYDIYRSDKHYFFYNNKFKQISSNINNGNIYTKEYLNRIKFPNDFGEDVEITFGNNSNINIINNDKYTMIYRWGTDTYHASIIVFGCSEYNNEKLLNIDNYIKNKENGIINLQPKFRNDYYLQINENI